MNQIQYGPHRKEKVQNRVKVEYSADHIICENIPSDFVKLETLRVTE